MPPRHVISATFYRRFNSLHWSDPAIIGLILALTIMLGTGAITRFPGVGNFASYCRCVGSQKLSNGKRKGKGNTKNGNKYLAWAFVEAANFVVRYQGSRVQKFNVRKEKAVPNVSDVPIVPAV